MGGVQKVVQSDVLCRFEVEDSSGENFRQYAFLTAPSARSGTHQAQQVFVLLGPVDWDLSVYEKGTSELAGLVLELQTLAYVSPMGSSHLPLQPELAGRLRMFTSDQFAAYLLDLPVRVDSSLDAVQVRAQLIYFQDILPRRVMVTGVGSTGCEMVATAESAPGNDGEEEPESDNGGDGDGDGDHCHTDALNDDAAPSTDLLSMLELELGVESAPKKRRKQRTTKKEEKIEPERTGDSILDDPCLQTFLSKDDLESLRSVRDLCKAHDLAGDSATWACFDAGQQVEEPADDIEDAFLLQQEDGSDNASDAATCSFRFRYFFAGFVCFHVVVWI